MIYEVVYCSDCNKPIKSVPAWLAGVNVRFTCEQCRQKHSRVPSGYDPAAASRAAAAEPDAEEVLVAPEIEPGGDDALEEPDVEADADPAVVEE